MASSNTFAGISIAYSVINDYYPVNYKNPYFDHFVFQPMIDDCNAADNIFTIAAYAVDADGTVLNNQDMLKSTPLKGIGHPATKKHIQFANMHLDLTDLGKLYPPGNPESELRVYPSGIYYSQNGKETAYMLYYAETGTDVGPDGIVKTPINPSPPY